ncbi:MAG TPA: beta-N-acetylhexosaminidase [Bacteroidales bacterium]|nr:beta-N-acetylhexosaminidase [Bacteroidales bacterium]
MKRRIIRQNLIIAAVALTGILLSCSRQTASEKETISIIPKPAQLTEADGQFSIDSKTKIAFKSGSDEVERMALLLQGKLKPATGFNLNVSPAETGPQEGIYIELTGNGNENDESYSLDINKSLLHLTAPSARGLFYGIQTIMQLLPADIALTTVQKRKWQIPACTINDRPVYAYRGVMLDVSRHFFSVEDVKKLMDEISMYKINTLHLHLSDDQGWRIEIKSWPKLTEIGGSTQVGGGKGGFYTQEQYSDLVKYAADRFITIVPEIDMPGHTNAALASYPELNCNGKATELYTGTEVGFSTFCTKKDITYKFIDDVVREISELTPGPWFHMGGDESHATKKEDYIPFVNKVQDIVISHNKQVIGWDEISLGTIRPNSSAQFWANAENAKNAVSQGAKLIMSPAAKAYLDMQYDKSTKLGLHWAAYIEVDSAYNWDPANLVPGITKDNILGVESPLWTETITNLDEIEYMVFPRLPGYAEIGWTDPSQRNWDEYKERLANHGPRFSALGIDYYPSSLVPWKEKK